MRAAVGLVAVFVLLAAPLAAQRAKLLPAGRVATGGAFAEVAHAADMTGDGLPDIVTTRNLHTTGFEPAGLVVLRQLAGGSDAGRFTLHSFKAAPRQPWFVLADVSGDGLVDVVSSRPPVDGSTSNPPVVNVFRSTPAGTLLDPLASPISAVTGEDTTRLQLADFDEDGAADVAVLTGTLTLRTIRVGLGHGNGSFGPFTSLAPATDTVAAGDVDGDGHADLVSNHGPVTLLGHGDGSLTAGAPSTPSKIYERFALGDLDGSGSLDFAASYIFSIELRAGQSGGSFAAPQRSFFLGDGTFLTEVIVRDLNEDGLNDIVATRSFNPDVQPHSGALLLLRGLGGLAFAAPEELTLGSAPNSLDFADLDDDGLQDLLVGQESWYGDPPADPTSGARPGVAVLFRHAPPAPDQSLAQAFGGVAEHELPWHLRRLAGGDLDADGRTDVLALLDGAPDGTQLESLLGDGTGLASAAAADVPGLAVLPFSPQRLQLGDMDADGADDLLLAGLGPAGLLAARSLGDGLSFAAPAIFGGSGIGDEVLVDADADGALDVLAVRTLENELDAHLGAANGSFAAALVTSVASLPRALAVADLDVDGLPDVVVLAGSDPQLGVLLGTGGGHFLPPAWFAAAESPDGLALVDLDDDGAPELVTRAHAAEVDVRAGLGGGAFGPSEPMPLEVTATALRSGDVDRDGRTDLLVLQPGADGVAFLGGDGAGGLLPAVGFLAGYTPVDALLADLDADGFPDLVSGGQDHFFTDAVWVQLGQSGPFTDLGYAKGGPAGTPKLVGSGTPATGQVVSFTATGLSGATLGFLFGSLESVHLPFKGGTLVPAATLMLPMAPNAPLAGAWPPLPAGAPVYLQAWFATPGGIVATNALVVVAE